MFGYTVIHCISVPSSGRGMLSSVKNKIKKEKERKLSMMNRRTHLVTTLTVQFSADLDIFHR